MQELKNRIDQRINKKDPHSKIIDPNHIQSNNVVFTNGCFGLLHPGHANYLYEASKFAPTLVVAINSDESYRLVKGREPPMPWEHRALLVASLECVDFVIRLNEASPHNLLRKIRPNFLVKSDSSELPPAGHEVVESYGGHVIVLPAFGNYSTTMIIKRRDMAATLEVSRYDFIKFLTRMRTALDSGRAIIVGTEPNIAFNILTLYSDSFELKYLNQLFETYNISPESNINYMI